MCILRGQHKKCQSLFLQFFFIFIIILSIIILIKPINKYILLNISGKAICPAKMQYKGPIPILHTRSRTLTAAFSYLALISSAKAYAHIKTRQ